ncbi:MAG: hypothetical protein ABJZ55_22215 [Fuerstiella sp.]
MSFSLEAFRRGKFNFGHAVVGFLSASGLSFACLLSEERVAPVFQIDVKYWQKTRYKLSIASTKADSNQKQHSTAAGSAGNNG